MIGKAVKPLKYIDKFLKFLKTDRNTFATYILTLITIYLVVDRVVEIVFLCLTGICLSYWGPITYTLAFACPVFAFLFCFASKFVKSDHIKLSFFYLYCMALYILLLSMIMQFSNQLLWLGLLSVPNYAEIVTEFSELIKPAFISIAIYFPITTAPVLFKKLYMWVNDTKDLRDSIGDYGGLSLSGKSNEVGPYTCEIFLGTAKETGQEMKIPEGQRFSSMLVAGPSGSGKTSMIFEPMMARDMEKKYFYRESSKELGFTALKTGLASLTLPYDNQYLNQNFRLSMITPNPGKIKIYKAYMKKMIYSDLGDQLVYRDLGLTSVSPDYETVNHMLEVAKNFGIKTNLIDPADPNSPGLNPFIYEDPTKTAVAISSVLKGMYFTSHTDVEQAFRENVAAQAIENLSILLKEMYPRMHNGDLPNLEDMLNLLNDFSLVEEMCQELEQDEELYEKHKILLGYFKKNFYQDGSGKADTEKFVYAAVSQLDNLLRYSGVKNILCNRTNNINYDKALAEGEFTFVCTRRGDLGASASKAFGLFFLLLMQYSTLRRPGNEKTRIPHFLYIDEFPDFLCNATETIFTMYRKYKVGTVISVQNLDQLGNKASSKLRQTILANCANKVVFGNNSPEDNEWWEKELAEKKEWMFKSSYNTDKGEYDPKYSDINFGYKANYKAGKVQSLKFKRCIIKYKDIKGKLIVQDSSVDFLASKYKEQQPISEYNFEKFTKGVTEPSKPSRKHKSIQQTDFETDAKGDIDPIKTDDSDTIFDLNSNDGMVFNFKKGNPNG